jgi:hypothetical protein
MELASGKATSPSEDDDLAQQNILHGILPSSRPHTDFSFLSLNPMNLVADHQSQSGMSWSGRPDANQDISAITIDNTELYNDPSISISKSTEIKAGASLHLISTGSARSF